MQYIETPRKETSAVKLELILNQRIKEFLLSRRRVRWIELGE